MNQTPTQAPLTHLLVLRSLCCGAAPQLRLRASLALLRPFGNSSSDGSSSSSHVPKLGYHSRGSLALLPLGSPAPVFIALSATLLPTSDSQKTCVSTFARESCPLWARCKNTALCCCVLRWPSSHVPPSRHSFVPSLLHRSKAPHSSSFTFPRGEPCTRGLSAAAGFRRRHAPAMTNLPFLRIDRQMLEHDVPVAFCWNA